MTINTENMKMSKSSVNLTIMTINTENLKMVRALQNNVKPWYEDIYTDHLLSLEGECLITNTWMPLGH